MNSYNFKGAWTKKLLNFVGNLTFFLLALEARAKNYWLNWFLEAM